MKHTWCSGGRMDTLFYLNLLSWRQQMAVFYISYKPHNKVTDDSVKAFLLGVGAIKVMEALWALQLPITIDNIIRTIKSKFPNQEDKFLVIKAGDVRTKSYFGHAPGNQLHIRR
ncbi:hypothetical protein [Zooshikella sp. RANM57]|uniref:hypothetical protein n=1 Tax=Zooshikella sp. RANM57 TaxID=3425863 RepID=UPI003D6EE3D0